MSSPFVAEIRIFAGNFAPLGWAFCNGQLMPISQNTALFSLIGTFYGGDGRSTFGLPNLQGSAPLGQGQGPGLTERFLGETGGEQFVTLLQTEMPAHLHTVRCSSANADKNDPTNNVWAVTGARRATVNQYAANTPTVSMSNSALSVAGGSLPHNNMPPYLALNFIIALQGVFPPRS